MTSIGWLQSNIVAQVRDAACVPVYVVMCDAVCVAMSVATCLNFCVGQHCSGIHNTHEYIYMYVNM